MAFGRDATKLVLKAAPEAWAARPRLLDIGTGAEGGTALFLLEHAMELVAVDKSPRAVAQLQQLVADKGISNFQAVCLDARNSLASLGQFQLCTAIGVLHHVLGMQEVLSSIYESLDAGGVLIILELYPVSSSGPQEQGCKGIDLAVLTKGCQSSGFLKPKLRCSKELRERLRDGSSRRRRFYIVTVQKPVPE